MPTVNGQCVPRREDGTCGDLMDALRWERLIELVGLNPMRAWHDRRGFGELLVGTWVHLPVPARYLVGLGIPNYTFGGVGGSCAAGILLPASSLNRAGSPRSVAPPLPRRGSMSKRKLAPVLLLLCAACRSGGGSALFRRDLGNASGPDALTLAMRVAQQYSYQIAHVDSLKDIRIETEWQKRRPFTMKLRSASRMPRRGYHRGTPARHNHDRVKLLREHYGGKPLARAGHLVLERVAQRQCSMRMLRRLHSS